MRIIINELSTEDRYAINTVCATWKSYNHNPQLQSLSLEHLSPNFPLPRAPDCFGTYLQKPTSRNFLAHTGRQNPVGSGVAVTGRRCWRVYNTAFSETPLPCRCCGCGTMSRSGRGGLGVMEGQAAFQCSSHPAPQPFSESCWYRWEQRVPSCMTLAQPFCHGSWVNERWFGQWWMSPCRCVPLHACELCSSLWQGEGCEDTFSQRWFLLTFWLAVS